MIRIALVLLCCASCLSFARGTERHSPHESAPIAFDGYCLVSAVEPGVWTKGESRFFVDYKGVRYLFLSEEEKIAFEKTPKKYAPAFRGKDLVAACDAEVAEGDAAPEINGKREFPCRHNDRTYFFASEDNMMKFYRSPHRYAKYADHDERMREEIRSRVEAHEKKRGKTIAELRAE